MRHFFTNGFALALLGIIFLPTSASALTREFGWDRPGYDYRSFDLQSPRMILCEYNCEKEARCKAWTYVKPGVQGPLARCWLKYAVPGLVKNSNCDSGTK